MYALADGTGGFPILNTNDMLGGLAKIAQEQDEYYFLGYAPSDSPDGSCHTLRVKMDHGGYKVRARTGYCTMKPKDMLAGKPVEKDLEADATNAAAGAIGGTLEAPFFYTSSQRSARECHDGRSLILGAVQQGEGEIPRGYRRPRNRLRAGWLGRRAFQRPDHLRFRKR